MQPGSSVLFSILVSLAVSWRAHALRPEAHALAPDEDPPDAGDLETSATDEVTVKLVGGENLSIKLEDGPGSSTILENASGKLADYNGSQVGELAENDTSFASSFVVAPIWAKLQNNTGMEYTVFLVPKGSHIGNKILFGFGIIPAVMAVGVALCTLPCFLMALARGNVLMPVGGEPPEEDSVKQSPKEDSVKETPKEGSVKESAEEDAVKEPPEEDSEDEDPVKFSHRELEHLQQIGEKMGIAMKPVFVLQPSSFTWATELWVTQLSLATFAAVQLVISAIFHLRLLLIEPFMVCIEVAEYALILLCCIALLLGKHAAAKTTREYAICPSTIRDQDIQTLLNKHLRRMSLMPFVPTLLLIYWCAAAFAVQPMIEQVTHKSRTWLDSLQLFNTLYKAIGLLNNECLLYCLFFKFMVDASVLARTVQSHAEAIAERIDVKLIEEYKEFFSKGKKKDEIGTEWLDNLHISIVRLARVVLPRLGTISGPILAFAICNWALGFLRMFRHLAVAADDGMSRNTQAVTSVLQVLFVHLPVGLLCLLPLAQVSDSCDILQEKVNNLREVAHPSDIDPIDRTEAYMQGANRGQGLGYQLYGTGMVVTKRALLALFAKAAGLASLVLSASYQIIKLQSSYRKSLEEFQHA